MVIQTKFIALLFFTFIAPPALCGEDVPVELPDGFSIKKVAGNELVPDASAMTVDPDGNPIVSGPGYVRRLIDKDSDHEYDGYETLAKTKGIAQGIWFDGKQMWLTVDGAIKRSVSKKEGEPFVFEDVVPITTDAEHGSHAIRRSADGLWWYVICGNATKIRDEYYSLPDSPIKNPRAGFLMRFPVDVRAGNEFSGEIVCHGLRNAYDFDFDLKGNVFVYDSDGERDVSLPWYRPTRVFKMERGDDAGWVSAGWKRPASFYDMPELVGEFGRGSPTGVTVCETDKFGLSYRDTVFVGDWTFGRIGVARRGTRIGGKRIVRDVEIFAKPKGNFGFAITDLEFAHDGSLFVTTGGRGTEGSLYRIARKPSQVEDLTEYNQTRLAEKNRQKYVELMGKRNGEKRRESADLESLKFSTAIILPKANLVLRDGVRRWQLMLGGCDGDRMFAGHQAATPKKLSAEERESMTVQLRLMLAHPDEKFEAARLGGMLALKDDVVANALAAVAIEEQDPVKRIHYLNCFAVAGGKLNADLVDGLAGALLRVRQEIDAAGLPVDRNWKPRMRQLADELFRDMRIPEAIVKDYPYGKPSDIWIYDSLPEVFREVARMKIVSNIQKDSLGTTRQQLQCIATDRRYSEIVRSFAERDEFRDVVVMSVYRDPIPTDKSVLLRGLGSFNLTVNKASLIGLKKLEIAKPESSDFASLMKLEQSLGWTNPEVSVRDQIVVLLQQWTGESGNLQGYFLRKYDLEQEQIRQQLSAMDAWKSFLANEYDLKLTATASTGQLLDRYKKIDFGSGDLQRGKLAYKKFQCASCHDGGGQNSGPSLAGIASRFSRDDVLRAIVDPNDNVPDRYRAVVVATEDGQLFRGSVVYESMAGIMIATSTGEIVRVDADDIESRRKSNKSLMPEGLLQNATDQDVADLWAYLSELK